MYTLGRWQSNGKHAYVEVHKNEYDAEENVIGSIDIHNVFSYAYSKSCDSTFFDKDVNKYHKKKFKSVIDCLNHLNGR